MTQKDVFLRAFKINTANPSKNVDLVSRLAQALNNSNSANDRRLNLNTNSEKEDLISSFKIEKQKIYCTMIRANIGNGVRSIAEDLLKQKTFQLSQLSKNELDGTQSILDFSYYLAIYDNLLITNLPRPHTISSTQAYLNWFVSSSEYEILPLIKKDISVQLSNIDSIVFEDSYFHGLPEGKDTEPSSETVQKSFLISQLEKLFVDASSFEKIDVNQLVSAKLVLQFKKKKIEESSDRQRVYGAMLKPIADLENITVRTRDKKRIVKGSNLQASTSVKIGVIENGLLEEPSLYLAMDKFKASLDKENDY